MSKNKLINNFFDNSFKQMDIDKPRLIYVSLKHVTWRKKKYAI